MYVGTICTVVASRGFCFIRTKELDDVFCHAGQLRDLEFNEQLKERRVEFELQHVNGRQRAANVWASND